MNLLNKLTIKNLKLNKKRTIVTIIGITLSVALITAVAAMYSSGIDSLIAYEKTEKGNYHVAYYDVPTSDLGVFKNNREIKNYYLTKDIGYAKIASKNEDKPYAFVKSFTDNALANLSIKLVEGRLPENNKEILIPTHLETNGRLELKVGEEITLDIGNRLSEDNVILGQSNPYNSDEKLINTTSQTFKIVGIIQRPDSSIESYSAPGYTFITLDNDLESSDQVDVFISYNKTGSKNAYKLTASILGVDADLFTKYYDGTASYEEITKYVNEEASKEKYKININSYLIKLENDPLGVSSVSGLAVVAGIVIIIIMFTSIFCIKNSFDISITEKIKQYGMLRSIGATTKQIKRNVFYEGTILGVIGIPLGIICGFLASFILLLISNYYFQSITEGAITLKFHFSFIAIIISIILGVITIYFSAFRSAKRASKISPIDSIRNSANIKIKAKKLKNSKLITKIFGIGGEMSSKNIKRNKKKYRTTMISLIVSVFVFIALSGFMSISFDLVDNELKIAEYNVSLSTVDIKPNESDKFNKYIATTKLDNIENYTILRGIGFDYKNRKLNPEYVEFLDLKLNDDVEEDATEYFNIYTIGNDQYQKYIKQLGLNYEEMHDKGILMDYVKVGRRKAEERKTVYKTLRRTDYKKGDSLTGTLETDQPFNIEIGYITDVAPFGLKNYQSNYLIISDDLFNEIATGKNSNFLKIFYKSNNASKLQKTIDEMLKNENYSLDNSEENVKMMENLFTLIGIFLYGFIIVISLIGITNIFNTITTSMELRKPEFAMLKSIGMTKKEFNKMIKLESLFIGLKALLFGVPIGILLSYIMYLFITEDSGIPYKLPWLAILISIIVVLILISLIMKYSLNKIEKQNIIETIRNENI